MWRSLSLMLTFLILAGCTTYSSQQKLEAENGYWADVTTASVSQNQRVRFLVLHYTALNNEKSFEILTKGSVSAHYLIPDQIETKNGYPIIPRLVHNDQRAWHAGVSQWGSRSNLNDTSIGIEIVNLGFTTHGQEVTWHPFPEEQIQALIPLAKDIIQRYNIEPIDVLGHSDIAPGRKSDPGPLFPWERLAQNGIGAWPNASDITVFLAGRDPLEEINDIANLQKMLFKYGYTSTPQTGVLDDETIKNIRSFQMHFRPSRFTGQPDAETEAILAALLKKYKK